MRELKIGERVKILDLFHVHYLEVGTIIDIDEWEKEFPFRIKIGDDEFWARDEDLYSYDYELPVTNHNFKFKLGDDIYIRDENSLYNNSRGYITSSGIDRRGEILYYVYIPEKTCIHAVAVREEHLETALEEENLKLNDNSATIAMSLEEKEKCVLYKQRYMCNHYCEMWQDGKCKSFKIDN